MFQTNHYNKIPSTKIITIINDAKGNIFFALGLWFTRMRNKWCLCPRDWCFEDGEMLLLLLLSFPWHVTHVKSFLPNKTKYISKKKKTDPQVENDLPLCRNKYARLLTCVSILTNHVQTTGDSCKPKLAFPEVLLVVDMSYSSTQPNQWKQLWNMVKTWKNLTLL